MLAGQQETSFIGIAQSPTHAESSTPRTVPARVVAPWRDRNELASVGLALSQSILLRSKGFG